MFFPSFYLFRSGGSNEFTTSACRQFRLALQSRRRGIDQYAKGPAQGSFESGSLRVPRHRSAWGHHCAQPRFSLGLTAILRQRGHFTHGSSFQNSTVVPQWGQGASKMSPGFQNLGSCPGHFAICQASYTWAGPQACRPFPAHSLVRREPALVCEKDKNFIHRLLLCRDACPERNTPISPQLPVRGRDAGSCVSATPWAASRPRPCRRFLLSGF